jgi:hypothetical protein
MKSLFLHCKFIYLLVLLVGNTWIGYAKNSINSSVIKDVVQSRVLTADLNLLIEPAKMDSTDGAELNKEPKRFTDESHKILLSTGILYKSYNITVENVSTGKILRLDPTGSVNLGFGFNYKWFGIAFSFGLPSNQKDKEEFGETQKRDYQINIYTDAFVAQGNMQRYKGFHASEITEGSNGIVNGFAQTPIISSLETYSLGASAWYFFNNKKFSYKAAYVRNAIQTKSAGSTIVGLYYNLDVANANSSIGDNLPDSIQNDFDVAGYRSRTIGISAGYSYTWVIKKKLYVNGTFVPGIGLKNVSLETGSNTIEIKDGFTGRLAFNFAMGYEAKHFLVGLRTFNSSRMFEADGLRISPTTNSVLLFVGKRFNVKKNKK